MTFAAASTGTPPWVTLLAALIALAGVLTGVGFGFYQWRRSHRLTRANEEAKLAWEREKLALTDQLDRQRAADQAAADERRRRREAAEAERRRRDEAVRETHSAVDLAARYRNALVEDLRSMRILDMARPLDLENLYVQVSVVEERSAALPAAAPAVTGADRDVRRGRAAVAAQAAVAYAPGDALRRFRRMAVLGDPGAGKTTMLRHLALRAAQGDLADLGTFPVYVELRRFVDSGHDDLVSFFVEDVAEHYGFADAGPYAEERLRAGEALLLLDGLDEVLGGASQHEASTAYVRVTDEINRLARRYPTAPIAVTCRRAGWRPTLKSFTSLDVLDFTPEQTGVFVDNWFADRPEQARQLRQELGRSLRMRGLATNPLLLSLIAIVFERRPDLPERRAELYARCADVLLQEWDAHRNIRRFSAFTSSRKQDLLYEVAWHFHTAGQRYFPADELRRVITEFLPSVDIAGTEADGILAEIAAQYGLLKEQAPGWYGFLHLTMQEYFAAVAANLRAETAVPLILRHRHDPWWEEVILLLAGRLNDATTLIRGILGNPSPRRQSGLAQRDDVFRNDTLLAGRCLAGSPRITDPTLRSRLIADLGALVRSADSELVAERAAATLAEIGNDEATGLLHDVLLDRAATEDAQVAAAHAILRRTDGRSRQLVGRVLLESRWRPVAARLLPVAEPDQVADLLPTLLDMLADPTLDTGLRPIVVAAAAATGARDTVLPVLEREAEAALTRGDHHELTLLIGAAPALGPGALPVVRRVFAHDPGVAAPAVLALGTTDDVRGLLRVLAEPGEPWARLAVGRSLHGRLRPAHLPLVAELAGDNAVDWPARWLMIVALEAAGHSIEDIRRIHRAPGAPREVAIAAATVLARHDETSVLTDLRAAIESRQISPDLGFERNGRTARAPGECYRQICAALHAWDDHSVVPTLLDRLSGGEASVIPGLAAFESDAVAERVLTVARSGTGGYAVWDTADGVVTPGTAGSATELAAFLAEGGSMAFPGLVRAIGAQAVDPGVAVRLWRLRGSAERWTVRAVDEAVDAICRRGRFRLFPDGGVERLDR